MNPCGFGRTHGTAVQSALNTRYQRLFGYYIYSFIATINPSFRLADVLYGRDRRPVLPAAHWLFSCNAETSDD